MPGCTISFEKIQIISQMSDSDHRDNDWMVITWLVNGTVARSDKIQLFNLQNSNVLKSSDFIKSFDSDLECNDNDFIIAVISIVNIGSIDITKQADAIADVAESIAQKVTEVYLDIAQVVLKSQIGLALGVPQEVSDGMAQLVAIFEDDIIKAVGSAFEDIIIPVLNEVVKLIGIFSGDPNCNGDALNETLVFPPADDMYQHEFEKDYDSQHKTGCGTTGKTSAKIMFTRTMQPKVFGSNSANFGPPLIFYVIEEGDGSSPENLILTKGKLLWLNQGFDDTGNPVWKGIKKVNSNWSDLKFVISGGNQIIYCVTNDGKLLWYRHAGDFEGIPNMEGPKVIKEGWNNFTKVFTDGNGILYTIDVSGNLWWFKHNGYLSGDPSWEPEKIVGTGWNIFSHVFGTVQGIIYGVVQQEVSLGTFLHPERFLAGSLLWYNHLGYNEGTNTWNGPKLVGKDWDMFKDVFSDGNDIICGIVNKTHDVYAKGDLLRYKHLGHSDGTFNWDTFKKINTWDWDGYSHAFIRIPPPVLIH